MHRSPSSNPLPRLFISVFAASVLCTSAVYAAMPMESQIGRLLSWVLLPGIALYTLLNNSLIFGSGFGRFGNFAIIVLGAATTWSVLASSLLALLVRRSVSRD